MAVMYGVWSFTVAAVVSLLLVVGVRPVSPLLQDVRAPHIRSPCQQVFDYRVRSDHYVFGLLTVPSPPVQRRSVPLLVAFQLRARLPTVSDTDIILAFAVQETRLSPPPPHSVHPHE